MDKYAALVIVVVVANLPRTISQGIRVTRRGMQKHSLVFPGGIQYAPLSVAVPQRRAQAGPNSSRGI